MRLIAAALLAAVAPLALSPAFAHEAPATPAASKPVPKEQLLKPPANADHYVVISDAGKHGDQRDVAPLWNALRGRATLVVNGHDHDLQRLRPRDGITELVAGAGGRSRYAVNFDDERLEFADDEHDGALRMELRPGGAGLSFVAVDGSVLDRSSVSCAR